MLVDKSDNWVFFSQAYLKFARLACQEVLQSSHNAGIEDFKLKYTANDIFIPIFYNIKHGIEIFIKSLKLILAEKLSKHDLNHNIDKLFKILKAEIQKHKIIEVIKKRYEEGDNDIDLKFAYNNELKIPEFLDKLEILIKKYFYCKILKDKIDSDFTIEDVNNTAFRYPDNNLKININYQEVASRITDNDIKYMKEDIDKLLENFNELGYILQVYKEQIKK